MFAHETLPLDEILVYQREFIGQFYQLFPSLKDVDIDNVMRVVEANRETLDRLSLDKAIELLAVKVSIQRFLVLLRGEDISIAPSHRKRG